MRRITVISTLKSTPVPYNSSATTWGELKDAVARDFGDVSGMKAVVKETRNSLDMDDAVLPTGDFTIFLTQQKIKAGGVNVQDVLGSLKQGFIAAFDNVSAKVNNGDFDVPESHPDVAAKASPVYPTASWNTQQVYNPQPVYKAPQPSISDEDRRFLAQLEGRG